MLRKNTTSVDFVSVDFVSFTVVCFPALPIVVTFPTNITLQCTFHAERTSERQTTSHRPLDNSSAIIRIHRYTSAQILMQATFYLIKLAIIQADDQVRLIFAKADIAKVFDS